MPTRLRIVRRKVEPSATDQLFAVLFIVLVIGAFVLLASELAAQMGAELLRQYGICRAR